jgi:hypothetical protein
MALHPNLSRMIRSGFGMPGTALLREYRLPESAFESGPERPRLTGNECRHPDPGTAREGANLGGSDGGSPTGQELRAPFGLRRTQRSMPRSLRRAPLKRHRNFNIAGR